MKRGTTKPAASSKFNAASYVKPGVSEADVEEIKRSFDLFDTDQGGSVDINGIHYLM